MKALLASIIVVMGLVAASPAHAKVHQLTNAAVSVDVPSKWKVTTEPGQLQLVSKDSSLVITMTHVPGNDLDGAWTETIAAIKQSVGNATISDRADGALGGMAGVYTAGSGSLNGASVDMLVTLVTTPRNHMLLVFALGQKGKYEKHQKPMEKLLKSIKARPYKINDEGFYQLSAEAQAAAEKVATLIEKNDQKGFLAMVETNEFAIGDSLGGADGYDKKQLKKALKKAKKIAKLLELPAKGDWHVRYNNDPTLFELWRGDWAEYLVYVRVYTHDGKWFINSSERGPSGPDGAAGEDM